MKIGVFRPISRFNSKWVGCYTFGSLQREEDWAGPQPAQAPPGCIIQCIKCNSPPINGQCTNHRTGV